MSSKRTDFLKSIYKYYYRVTILCNKFDGHPKGFAYIEFGDKDSVQTAMAMDESLFRGRQIKVYSRHYKGVFKLMPFHRLTDCAN